MKTVLFLFISALALTNVLSTNDICKECIYGCPIGEGDCVNIEPNCTGVDDPSKKFRNNLEPEYYWICEKPTRPAARRCRNDYWFYEEVGDCVPIENFRFTCPCNTCDLDNCTL